MIHTPFGKAVLTAHFGSSLCTLTPVSYRFYQEPRVLAVSPGTEKAFALSIGMFSVAVCYGLVGWGGAKSISQFHPSEVSTNFEEWEATLEATAVCSHF